MNKNTDNSSDSTILDPNSSQVSLFSLADFDKKKVDVSFTSPKTSSDGGLVLLREVDKQIGLIDKLSACRACPAVSADRYDRQALKMIAIKAMCNIL